jgi:L-histidine Nalpha-methyltransferase
VSRDQAFALCPLRGEEPDVARQDDAVLEFARAVAAGLSDCPRRLPSRYLYDARGSRLFDRICETPEYYLPRMETALLEASIDSISGLTGNRTLVELGAGTARKTGRILETYARDYGGARYLPVDISAAALEHATRELRARYPTVAIRGHHGTYEAVFPTLARLSPLLLMFLGSTLGNLDDTESAAFWTGVCQSLTPGDFVLLGVDLAKDPGVVQPAYNDAAGWSAAFTRNIFVRINRELGAELELDAIEHEAVYRPDHGRVEIFGRLTRRQRVWLAPLDATLTLEAGDRVMTEISRKFDLADLQRSLEMFGLEPVRAFTDPREWYALLLLRRGP